MTGTELDRPALRVTAVAPERDDDGLMLCAELSNEGGGALGVGWLTGRVERPGHAPVEFTARNSTRLEPGQHIRIFFPVPAYCRAIDSWAYRLDDDGEVPVAGSARKGLFGWKVE